MRTSIKVLCLASLLTCVACQSGDQSTPSEANKSITKEMNTIYGFSAKTIEGEAFDFNSLKGKKIMLVNTASECGLTPQYEQLQAVHEKYGSDDFKIIGFPANEFGAQEPGSNQEIAKFCKQNYGVSFQMMEKIVVKGKGIHPLYAWLTEKDKNGKIDAPVQWNFQKFLINENGEIDMMIPPQEKPDSETIIQWIKS